MNRVKKFISLALPVLASAIPIKTFAFCPVCVVATGTGLGILRWIGVDDSISGLWIGGFTLSTSIFLNNFLVKKGKNIKFQLPLILIVFYGTLFYGLDWKFGFFNPFNRILGIDKVVFGVIAGTALLALSPYIDKGLRKLNADKIFISHQKVFVAIFLLSLSSIILYFITK